MKISYNWLKQHLTVVPEIEALDDLLTQVGLEVEDVALTGVTPDKLKGLVVGEVMSCVPHPNADKLKLTQVNIGSGELLHIVCGAPNVAQGLKVVVATTGVTLYPSTGEPFKIKKSKIRGEESNGMLCAEDEIGLGSSHAGLIILPPETEVGSAVFNAIKTDMDALVEIGITPNHADACSHLGVARELRAAMMQKGLETALQYDFSQLPDVNFSATSNPISVSVANSKECPRYAGLYIENVVVSDSPEWLQQHLKSIGQKPINNIVDITNYILHDTGQPIHAFDAGKINGKQINVRLSNAGETMVTLEGTERKLSGSELLICDQISPLAIAGVFGGKDSGVSAETKSIFIESAYFDPGTVRKSARAQALNTDASFRFERGTDPEMVLWALYKTAQLVLETAGGNASAQIVDLYPEPIKPFEINLRFDYLNKIIGNTIPPATVKNILQNLNCQILQASDSGLLVQVPAYKNDVTTEIDLCEEVLRIYGLNAVELPQHISISLVHENDFSLPAFREKLIQNLSNKGYNEIMTNSLTKSNYPELQEGARVALLNPLSAELGVMRDVMLYSGLEVIAYNLNRNIHQLQVFEIGKTYNKSITNDIKPGAASDAGNAVKYKEEEHCAIYLTGKEEKLHALKPVTAPNFYTLKSLVVSILQEHGVYNYKLQPSENKLFSYGLAFTQNNKVFAEIGAVHPSILKAASVNQEVFYGDILMKNFAKYATKGFTKVKQVPKFPAVRRDLSLLLDEAVEFGMLESVARKAEPKILKEVGVFDIYKGDKLGAGKKSYALYFNLQDEEKTLDDKTINNAMGRIQQAFEKEFGAVVR